MSTIKELPMIKPEAVLDALQAYIQKCNELGIDPELRVASQPSWPMSSGVKGIVISEDGAFVLGVDPSRMEDPEDIEDAWCGTDRSGDADQLEKLEDFAEN